MVKQSLFSNLSLLFHLNIFLRHPQSTPADAIQDKHSASQSATTHKYKNRFFTVFAVVECFGEIMLFLKMEELM